MTYTEFVARIASYLVEDATEANFNIALPAIIEQAELRCYRDVDFVVTRQVATVAVPLAAGACTIAAPADWVIGNEVRIMPGLTKVRTTLMQRDETFLTAIWPDRAAYTVGISPKYWAEAPAGTIAIAPTADTAYVAELVYRNRPAALSPSNTTTWLSLNAADLMFAAAMVVGSGYTKNFGQGSDNPQMAMSWEAVYRTALEGIRRQEGRRKGEGTFDSSTNPPPASDQP